MMKFPNPTRRAHAARAALVAILAFPALAFSAPSLVEYDFDSDLAPSKIVKDLRAGDVAWGSFGGVSPSSGTCFRSGGAGRFNSANLAIRRRATSAVAGEPAILATSAADALSTRSYVEFTVTPSDRHALALSSLSVWVAAQQLGDAPAFTASFFVRSSADDYATTLAAKTVDSTTAGRPDGETLSVTLDGGDHRKRDTAVTFRIYVYAESDTAWATSGQLARIDQIVLTGTRTAR